MEDSREPESSPQTPGKEAFARAQEQFREKLFLEAWRSIQEACQQQPGNPATWNLAAATAQTLGQLDEAEKLWRTAIALQPNLVEAHYNLAVLLHQRRRLTAAAEGYRRVLALASDHTSSLNNLAAILEGQGQLQQALQLYEHAIAVEPTHAKAHHNRGLILNALGRFDEALPALQRAIDLAPHKAPFYRSLAFCKRFDRGDPQLIEMERLVSDAASLSESDRIQLHFALGKAYDDLHDHKRAFGHWQDGNAGKRRSLAYDEPGALTYMQRTREAFSIKTMRAREGIGYRSAVPVFIVGMPRSGSTLVEQILASHPQVFGAGERDEFKWLAESIRSTDGHAALPEAIGSLPDEMLRQLGQQYTDMLAGFAPKALRITDKMPKNFLHVGLIHLALPEARIIHIRRNPKDTCLSCFAQLFNGDYPYAYNLSELGRYWRAYDALMNHWREVLPAGVMIEVQYEELIAAPEAQTRRLLTHCGLEWDERCLAFHRNERPVRTSSAMQVRRALYQTAVNRWKAYEAWLTPLLDALGEL